jgi:thiosulfate/3-mercaptopyruvate sulfurtransferase
MTHPLIVTADWLNTHLPDRDLVVVDCRFALADPSLGRQQYQTDHIPGAFYLDLNTDLSSPVCEHGGRHPLPDPQTLAQKLTAIGVKFSETFVVVYDDSRFAFASRLWWLLRYYGHARVAVLDGGYRNWVKAGYSVTADLPQPPTDGKFIPQIQANWIVDIEGVKARQSDAETILIDSREPDRYLGKVEPIDPVAGHIPGAVNYPWQTISTPEGFFLPLEAQQQRWSEIQPQQTPIVYCGSGVTACVNLLSLAIAGIDRSQLYPGSWSDWCSYLEDRE